MDLSIGEDIIFYYRCLIAVDRCRDTDWAGYDYV